MVEHELSCIDQCPDQIRPDFMFLFGRQFFLVIRNGFYLLPGGITGKYRKIDFVEPIVMREFPVLKDPPGQLPGTGVDPVGVQQKEPLRSTDEIVSFVQSTGIPGGSAEVIQRPAGDAAVGDLNGRGVPGQECERFGDHTGVRFVSTEYH